MSLVFNPATRKIKAMSRLFLILLLCLSACSGGAGLNLGNYPDPNANKNDFIYCYGYGCRLTMRLGFNKHEWNSISKIFKKKSKTAKIEQKKIAKAIALMEKYTGVLAGTSEDLAKAPIVRKNAQELDCIDETLNTTKYLKFLEADHLLKWYQTGNPTHKGYFINGVYPHNTATLKDKETGEIYVVDSYMFQNGKMPIIQSLKEWLSYGTFTE
jgi:hypothetical protein